MLSTKPFNSILELLNAFPTEQSCIDHMEQLRWDGNVTSPYDETSSVYKCSGNRYKCRNTNKYFNVRTGTIFEGTKIPLRTWFLAIFLFTSHKRGISSYQIASDLKVTQKTSWFLLSRIRYAMEHETFLREMEGTIESDETFVGGKNKNRHKDKKVEKSSGRSFKDKTPILGLMERGEYEYIDRPNKINPELAKTDKIIVKAPLVRFYVIPNTKANSIEPLVYKTVKEGSNLMSDEWHAYKYMGYTYNHQIVNHGARQYVDGDATTNRIENFWSHLKRAIIGTYYQVSPKHLQKYANEMSFRFNAKDSSVSNTFNLFLETSFTRRITYKALTHGGDIS